jgi:phosphonoacetate hydrolase
MSTQKPQRIVAGMIDGFGLEYYDATALPFIRKMASTGLFLRTRCVFPSVTNVNNASIVCSAWPNEHGINANSYYNRTLGTAEYMNAHRFIRKETIFRRARRQGVKCAMLTAKRKSVELFAPDADLAVTAEDPPAAFIERFGKPGPIYSREINYWLWWVAAGLLKDDRDLGLIYVHTTDYPMHRWAPETRESAEHLQTIDELLEKLHRVAPDAAIFLTADHSMNAKSRCWDLTRVCADEGTPIQFALSPERDYYIQHHRNFTGCAWVWLRTPADERRVRDIIGRLKGVETILSREEASARFHLTPDYLGDLNVFGDKDTMFGDMDTAYELLSDYRAHGSLHEMNVPLIVYNYDGPLPPRERFAANKDLLHFLYQ